MRQRLRLAVFRLADGCRRGRWRVYFVAASLLLICHPRPALARDPIGLDLPWWTGGFILSGVLAVVFMVVLWVIVRKRRRAPGRSAMMETLARIQGRYIERLDETDPLDDILQDVLALTDSAYGVLRVGVGSTLIFTEELRAVGWRNNRSFQHSGEAPLPPLEAASTKALEDGKPLIGDSHHLGRTMSFCAVPLSVGPERFGVIALANRDGGYTTRLLDRWAPVLTAVAHILHALHQRKIGDQARDALRHATRQQRLILDNMADGVLILSEALIVTHANKAGSTLFGFSGNELTGRNGKSLFDLREADRPDGLGVQQLDSASSRFLKHSAETTAIKKNGDKFPVEMQISRITQRDRPAYVLSLHDITKRQDDEKVLRQSEHETRTILDNMADTFYRTDLQGRIVIISKSVSMLLGLPPRTLLGRRMADLHENLDDRTTFHKELNARSGRLTDFQTSLRHKNGDRVWVSINARYCRDSQGVVTGIEGTIRDITSRLAAERALADNERKFRAIADYTFDWESWIGPDGELIWVSNGVEAITGHSTDDCHAMDDYPLPLVHPDDRAGVSGALCLDSGANHTFRILRRDGSALVGALAWRTISDSDGKPLGLRTSIHDITEMRQAEQHLVQQAKLATLGETAAGLAHELSQPLNIIRLSAEGTLLRLDDGQCSQDEQSHQFSVIESQAKRMGEIIDHIRVFSRKDTDETAMYAPLDAITAAMDLVEVQFRTAGVVLERTLCPQTGLVRGAQVQLEQVILNLLTNARDSILEKRRQGVGSGQDTGTDVISVTVETNAEGHLVISVTDTGTGFPAAALDQVFEPFYTTKEVGEGTGLGLSVSADIIASLDGSIHASNTATGARIDVSLPLGEAVERARKQTAQKTHPATPVSDAERHILVVDDEPAAANALATFVESLGYRVSVGYDGMEAQEIFGADPADIVITDIRMPQCDGHELMRRLRDQAPALPIIVTTGHFADGQPDSGMATATPDAILRKPVSLEALRKALITIIEKSA